jgi:hypothetical protein
MKRIISNKVYDTTTAQELASSERGGLSTRDLHYVCETLFRKRTGEYFLFCEGGAGTQYARSISANHWASGETIQPLLYAEAREWAETYLSAEKFESLFGEIAEDSSTTPVTLCLTKAARTALEREQSRTGKTASGIVSELIAANL